MKWTCELLLTMFGIEEGFQQEQRQPRFENTKKNSQIHKGNVLCRRKTVRELLNDEKRRLSLPNITQTTPKAITSCWTGKIKKGYTFIPNNVKTKTLHEEDIDKVLLLTPLDSIAGKCNKKDNFSRCCEKNSPTEFSDEINTEFQLDTNHCLQSTIDDSCQIEKQPVSKHIDEKETILSKQKEERTEQNEIELSNNSYENGQYNGVPPTQQNVQILNSKTLDFQGFSSKSKPSISAEIGASMCTQSLNSLRTELQIFKDAAKVLTSQALLKQQQPEHNAARPNSLTSDSIEATVTIFKNHKRAVLSRAQKSRNSNIYSPQSRSSTHFSTPVCNDDSTGMKAVGKEGKIDPSRRESVISDNTNESCICFTQPQVQVKLKGKNADKSDGSQFDKNPVFNFNCYKPQQLRPNKLNVKFPQMAQNSKRALTLPRIPCKTADVEAYFVHHRSLEARHSVSSNPELSPRELPNVVRMSHEWPEDFRRTRRRRTMVDYNCNRWLNQSL